MSNVEKDAAAGKETVVGKNILGLVSYWGTALLCWVGLLFFPEALARRSSGAWFLCACGAVGIPILMLFWRRFFYYYYGVSEKGLTEYRFGKKQREIPWGMVKQVGMQHDLMLLGGYAPCVIVTLEPAEPFNKDDATGSARYYRSRWPKVLMINANQHAQQAIEWYYGKFDY